MASKGVIGWKDLKLLPIPTLKQFAKAAARDIDNGEEDKRIILEKIFDALAKKW